ncbi:hypothetical protein ACHHYP_04144 [Achlya hypogyna]|uniref:Uncharacterized protein n=1 Tax=Achlya hypogyna TaxID=1202772 RepID=A0A1V9Z215_ACHHY|nr:hypothetical protein ACHHYP_04144 [Achlya hypogyna]
MADTWKTCSLCCERFVGPLVERICGTTCVARVCQRCLCKYIASVCSARSVLASAPCPVCAVPVPVAAWGAVLTPADLVKLGLKLAASCASFCPRCSVHLPLASDPTTWMAVLSDKYDELRDACFAFDAGDASAAQLLHFLFATFGPFTRAIVPAVYQWISSSDRLWVFITTKKRWLPRDPWFPCCLTTTDPEQPARKWGNALEAWTRRGKPSTRT